jgi:RNA polymerase sigma-70 factor (ECF subfamily)
VASVNSALQRARATLDATDPDETPAIEDQAGRELLTRYVSAFDAHDAEALVSVSLADYSGGCSN